MMRHNPVIPDVSLAGAAEICGVSRKTIQRWVKSGLLHAVKVGGRYRTTIEWLQSLSVAVRPAEHEVNRNVDCSEEKARKRLEQKWGLKKKVPCS